MYRDSCSSQPKEAVRKPPLSKVTALTYIGNTT